VHHRALERIAAALAPYDVFHRLRAVKAAYDPDNLFRANHPIPLASS
jgi:FAD/FMN-containing dehydrogenase